MVWNPQSCIKDVESKDLVRHKISPQVFLSHINKALFVSMLIVDNSCFSVLNQYRGTFFSMYEYDSPGLRFTLNQKLMEFCSEGISFQ